MVVRFPATAAAMRVEKSAQSSRGRIPKPPDFDARLNRFRNRYQVMILDNPRLALWWLGVAEAALKRLGY